MGLSHAIVSRHLKALENWLGITLIQRPGGKLTQAGADYHQRVSFAIEQIGGATEVLLRSHAARLEIWCVPGFAYLWLTARLRQFSGSHPFIALDLRPTDSSPLLLHHQADADIRYVRDGQDDTASGAVRTVELARPRVFPVASPAMARQFAATIVGPRDLIETPLLHEENDGDWLAWFSAQGIVQPLKPAIARLWQAHITLGAAREGQGIALTNAYLSHDDLAAGRLVEIGAGNPAFRSVAIGAYVLSARTGQWSHGSLAKFRVWLQAASRIAP